MDSRRCDPRRAEVETADHAVERVHQLEIALETNRVIGRAQGILMERYVIDADAAIAILRRASSNLNVKVVDIAASLVETRQLPELHRPR